MPYKQLNLPDQIRGDTWEFKVIFQDNSSSPIDITGNQYWFTVKDSASKDDNQALIQIGPVAPKEPTLGSVTFTTLPDVTENINKGTYLYDVQEVSSSGKVSTILLGKLKVLGDVTLNRNYAGTPTTEVSNSSGVAIYSGQTSTTSSTPIYLDGVLGALLPIKENSVLSFNVLVAAKDTITKESAAFEFVGAVERDSGNSSSAIGSFGKYILGKENSLFDSNIVVNSTSNTLSVNVASASSNLTSWSARLVYTEVFL